MFGLRRLPPRPPALVVAPVGLGMVVGLAIAMGLAIAAELGMASRLGTPSPAVLPAPAVAPTRQPPGALDGRVRLAGDRLPGPTRVANTTDPAVCGEVRSLEDLVVSPESRGVRHVIAALADLPPGRAPPTLPDTLVLDNRECRFVPHAAVLTVGSTVVAANSDPTLHNVHFYGPLRSNIALPVRGMRVTRTVRRAGLVAVKCDVHGWMQAYIRVDDHPFHAVTDPDGRFRIVGIPPGEYAVEFWHERLGRMERTVEIEPGETAELEVELSLPDRSGPSRREVPTP